MKNHTTAATSLLLFAFSLLGMAGCQKKEQPAAAESTHAAPAPAAKQSIQDIGSDTMVNLAQAWAEAYAKVSPLVSIEVSGGGSGIGIAALLNGTADIANSSRKLEEKEIQKIESTGGKHPNEYVVAYDAVTFFVHKDNPMSEIAIEDLAQLYKEGGKIDKWSQLGVKNIPGSKGDNVVRVSRQNNSGTYHYVREVVIGKSGDFKSGSLDMNGSKDVVELIARTPNAIGYSGLGYATAQVKILKIASKKGQPAVMPSIQSTLDKSYPISRPLFMYTPSTESEAAKKYIGWVMSDVGQKIVVENGYVPLKLAGGAAVDGTGK